MRSFSWMIALAALACSGEPDHKGRNHKDRAGDDDDNGDDDDGDDDDDDDSAGDDDDDAVEEQCDGISFADAGADWSLPQLTNDYISFYRTAGNSYCGTDGNYNFYYEWSTFDIDGDADADLVMTGYSCDGEEGVSTERWDVYLNNGSGFDDTPVAWSLPQLPNDYISFYRTAGNSYCGTDGNYNFYYEWSTFDIDGDRDPDLVLTGYSCDGEEGMSTERWDVYLNNGSGFDDTPVAWSLPQLPNDYISFYRTAGNSYCGTDGNYNFYYEWSTFDIDGDRDPDLVLTGYSCDGEEGMSTERWDVYLNNGSGFDDTPVAWSLPQLTNDYISFYRTAGNSYCGTDGNYNFYYEWSTFDIDGDGDPDLVLTGYSCDGEEGMSTERWDVYLNNGSGFDDTPIAWSLPQLPNDYISFYRTAGNSYCGTDGNYNFYYEWSTFDIDGDRDPDLVLTGYSCDGEEGMSTERWDVYLNNGSGFDDTPIAWSLPQLPNDYISFYRTAGNSYCGTDGNYNFYYEWSTFDLDGDSLVDLVMTGYSCDGEEGVSTQRWDIYPGVCEP